MAKSSFSGELIHFNAIRLRVTGSGNLKLTLNSLEDVNPSVLTDLAMQASTNREPTTLANYIEQMGYLEFKTTEINETFAICKIVIFVRPMASGYPQ